ncbi:phage major capsid protein [Psychrobacter sp. DAB_AL32B]|uniref:phage major capsid protein n=1 Tax=Psychrobacter sp. DAB_AL32B TaxID=1028414 RepID=UPI000B7DF25A|nr:phage major capsid protein [Psychrobacter sp. DAB_AL32B]OXL25277.1 phage major capsid protein [Psychrobacter sp. DAB_AL32B]
MNWAKQRAQLIATIKSKKGKIKRIIAKAAKENETPDEEAEEEIEVLEEEIVILETNLERIEEILEDILDAADEAAEVIVENDEEIEELLMEDEDPDEEEEKGSRRRRRRSSEKNYVSVKPNHAKKGIAFAQFAKAKAISILNQRKGNYVNPLEIAKSQGMDPRVIKALKKAVVLDTSNSSSLVVQNTMADEFVSLLRAQTVVDKIAEGMRSAPFNTTVAGLATGSTAAWVGEGEKKPATNPTFLDIEIKHHKLAGIVVMTEELLRLATPSADKMMLDDLVEASVALIDTTFLDDLPQTANRPAGILNGAPKVVATGITVDTYGADLAALRRQFISNGLSLSGAHYIMSETRASDLGELRDALGNPYYRGMDAPLGEKTLGGLPVIESETSADVIALVKPSEIYLADDGEVQIDYSDQATIDMGASTLVNLFQENKIAIRAERYITWAKRRVAAAAYIDYSLIP